jgi:putative Mg2+ transporter-C (MgtC) family protein
LDIFSNFNIDDALSHLIALALAYGLALPIGWNREKEERSAGVRTFPLVAMAACSFVLISTSLPGATPDVQSRILAGLMTGIGFVGGGAILKQGDRATGTATAASLWATGAIGAAVGYGELDIALILSLVIFLTLTLLAPLHKAAQKRDAEDR